MDSDTKISQSATIYSQAANSKILPLLSSVKKRSGKNVGISIVLEITAWFLFIIGLALIFISAMLSMVAGVCWLVAIRARRMAKGYRLNALNALLRDKRDPVLYLRSFDDDSTEFSDGIIKTTYKQFQGNEHEFVSKIDATMTSEEMLVEVFQDMGPVIAIGIPNEKLSPLGAIRMYFTDIEWREKVIYLMEISQFVVLQADISEGLEWEISTSRKSISPDKFLISFLPWEKFDAETKQRLYQLFRPKAELLIGCSMPENIGKASFVLFDSNWDAILIEIKTHIKLIYMSMSLRKGVFNFLNIQMSSATIRESLRPHLKEGKVKLGFKKTVWKAAINLISFILIAYSISATVLNSTKDENSALSLFIICMCFIGYLWHRKRSKDIPPSIITR